VIPKVSEVGVDDTENSDDVIGETGVEVLLVLGPDEGSAANWGWGLSVLLVLFGINDLGLINFSDDLISVDELSSGKIIDSDTVLGTDDEPVELGGEEDNIDGALSIDFIKMSSFGEVPDVDLTVSASGGNEVGVGSQIEGVDLSLMSDEGVHEGHDLVIPDLDGLVPRGGDNDWLLDILEISDAGDPVGMGVLVNSEFALTVDVPNLNVLVHGSRGDLPVIWGEGNGENIFLVTDKGSSGSSSLQVPESDGTIPRGGEAESAVLREIEVGDEMGVSLHDLSWLSPGSVFIGVSSGSDVPDDEGSVSGSGNKEFLENILGDLFFSNLHAGNHPLWPLRYPLYWSLYCGAS